MPASCSQFYVAAFSPARCSLPRPARPPVLQDLRMLPLADACRATAARCPNFSDAAALLRVWARQQQLITSADGLSGCLLTLLLVHAVESSPTVSLHTAASASLRGSRWHANPSINACTHLGLPAAARGGRDEFQNAQR